MEKWVVQGHLYTLGCLEAERSPVTVLNERIFTYCVQVSTVDIYRYKLIYRCLVFLLKESLPNKCLFARVNVKKK